MKGPVAKRLILRSSPSSVANVSPLAKAVFTGRLGALWVIGFVLGAESVYSREEKRRISRHSAGARRVPFRLYKR